MSGDKPFPCGDLDSPSVTSARDLGAGRRNGRYSHGVSAHNWGGAGRIYAQGIKDATTLQDVASKPVSPSWIHHHSFRHTRISPAQSDWAVGGKGCSRYPHREIQLELDRIGHHDKDRWATF